LNKWWPMAEGNTGLYMTLARKNRRMKEILETRFQKPYWYKLPNASWQYGALILSTSPRSFFLLRKTRLGYLFWRQAILIDVLSGYLQFVSLNSGWGKKTSNYACLCFCDSGGRNSRMTAVSYRHNERVVCSTNVDHLKKKTVKPCYNNIALCDTSSITTEILLQQLIARC
jgi:hypothetical protein